MAKKLWLFGPHIFNRNLGNGGGGLPFLCACIHHSLVTLTSPFSGAFEAEPIELQYYNLMIEMDQSEGRNAPNTTYVYRHLFETWLGFMQA